MRIFLLVVLTGGIVLLAGAGGAWAGYRTGLVERQAIATQVASLSLEEQYELALDDLNNERYDLARQRLEYILTVDPGYPGVSEPLAQAMAILYATATPTAVPPSPTPSPTPDLRPVQDLLAQGRALVAQLSWTEAIDTLLALRKADPAYETARVDGLLFISLRQRGFDQIWKNRNLEGGIYDLALAARFAPLDAQAASARELARLYLFGSAFWEVYPEQAANFFGQVAAAAPGLTDASGWTAAARYAEALVQWADQIAAGGDACEAQMKYEEAMRAGAQGASAKRDEAALRCSPPTEIPQPTSVSTTEPPLITTEPPVVTTEPPVETTEPPVETTEPPVETTEPPVETTEPPPPVETTEPPPVLTEPPPAETTEPPPMLTLPPIDTTEPPPNPA